MNLYQQLVYPVLRYVDAERIHEQMLTALSLTQRTFPGRKYLRLLAGPLPQKPVQLWGLTFPNVLGVAAGFDKDVRIAPGLAQLGFGHIEVGTLTPRPQVGNPRPRIFRLAADGAIINRMGFPNEGAEAAVPRLKALARKKRSYILGVSMGKQKETPLAEAVADYQKVMQLVLPYADYLAVNISSPNTPGLRELQGGAYLSTLLNTLIAENKTLATQHKLSPRPLLVKIAPDLSWPELDEILDVVLQSGIDGIIATNTTLNRPSLSSRHKNEKGGLSGAPLTQRATEIIAYIAQHTEGKLPIIGAGGVRSGADAQAKLDAGAALVQLYTGLVYEGPGLAGRMLRQMSQ